MCVRRLTQLWQAMRERVPEEGTGCDPRIMGRKSLGKFVAEGEGA